MRVPMHDSIQLEQQARAWRIRIKRRLRCKFPSAHHQGGNGGCRNLEFVRALIDAVDLLSPGPSSRDTMWQQESVTVILLEELAGEAGIPVEDVAKLQSRSVECSAKHYRMLRSPHLAALAERVGERITQATEGSP